MKYFLVVRVLGLCLLACASQLKAQEEQFNALQSHFERVAHARFDTMFASVKSIEQWEARKKEYKRQLYRMLWHEMKWPDQPPSVQVTHRSGNEKFTVENLVLETMPGIFSTCNLYLPRKGKKPFPVILYQCGHTYKRVDKPGWFHTEWMPEQ